jgi:hypothetical protein
MVNTLHLGTFVRSIPPTNQGIAKHVTTKQLDFVSDVAIESTVNRQLDTAVKHLKIMASLGVPGYQEELEEIQRLFPDRQAIDANH